MKDLDPTVALTQLPQVSSLAAGRSHETLVRRGAFEASATLGTLGRIGRFEVLRLLGEGGMGLVYLAQDPSAGAEVAVKVMRPEASDDPRAVHRFLTEARHMGRMSHPHILRVLEVLDRKEGPCYVMPYAEGGSLLSHCRPGEPLPDGKILPIMRQLAGALAYAHAHGVIHRDLKPGNVLLDKAGRVLLTDFGLVRTVFNDSMIDVTARHLEGTAPYMSPAVANGEAEDTRCDIYAFGAVLYELLTGRPPYSGRTPQAVLDQVLAGPPQPIRKLAPKANPSLVHIAEGCMARELRDRYASMADVAADLERVAKGALPLGLHQRRWPRAAALLAGVLAAAGLAWFAVHHFTAVAPVRTKGPVAAQQFPPGLIAWWPGNGTVDDIVGHRKGVAVNGADYAPGLNGLAFRVNGRYQYFNIPHDPSLSFTNGSAVTLEAWVYRTWKGLPFHIMGKRPVPERNVYWYQLGYDRMDPEVPTNQWVHLVVTAQNNEGCRYMNGALTCKSIGTLESNPMGPQGTEFNVADLQIGCAGPYFGFAGLIDDVRIYNRALSQSEVAALYKAGLKGYSNESATADSLYLVIDLSGGAGAARYPVSYLDAVPAGGWTDDYKTGKLVLRKLQPGTFFMGSATNEPGRSVSGDPAKIPKEVLAKRLSNEVLHAVVLTQPFYIGVFEVTQRQWELVMGSRPSFFSNEQYYATRPAECVTYLDIRGQAEGTGWPTNEAVEATSFVGRIRARTGLRTFDLPTEAQWEYACRAGSTTSLDFGNALTNLVSDDYLGLLARYRANSKFGPQTCRDKNGDLSAATTKVGSYRPSPWGLYDMHGNVWEWCLDWYRNYPETQIDPKGMNSGESRVLRGGSWFDEASACRSPFRYGNLPSSRCTTYGLRVAMTLPGSRGTNEASAGRSSAEHVYESPFVCSTNKGTLTVVKYTGPGGSVTIPEKINGVPVTGIGLNAFASCDSLTDVTIPDSVTSIGWCAFFGCRRLTEITIPASVVSIEANAFFRCDQLMSVRASALSSAFSSGEDGVLFNKDKTRLVRYPSGKAGRYVIPDKVAQLGFAAFQGSSSLTSVTIPNTVVSIEHAAFADCPNLAGVSIPASVTSVAMGAFFGCGTEAFAVDAANSAYSSGADGVLFDKQKTCLVSYPGGKSGAYVIPNSVTGIVVRAFNSCNLLTKLTIPNQVTSIPHDALLACRGLKEIVVDETNPVYSSSSDGVLFNKEKTSLIIFPGGKAGRYEIQSGVTSVSSQSFRENIYLTDVTIPGSVVAIENDAFKGCASLRNIYFKGHAPSVGAEAFAGDDSATIYYLHGTQGWGKKLGGRPTAVWEGAVQSPFTYTTTNGTITITKYTGPGGAVNLPKEINGLPVTDIGYAAFVYRRDITNVTIPYGVSNIWAYAFTGTRLTSVIIPKSVKYMDSNPFGYNSELMTITVDAANTAYYSSDDGVVFNKEKTCLVSYPAGKSGDYVIPADITDIGVLSFNNCTKLTCITIPNSVTKIGNSAFVGCSGLTNVTIPGRVTSLEDRAFGSCSGLISISVDAANPAYCTSEDGVVFDKQKTCLFICPAGKTGEYVVPKGVDKIRQRAFDGCANLIRVTIPEDVKSLGGWAFAGCINLTGIYFKGDAPRFEQEVFEGNKKVTVYYRPGTKGWGSTFGGRPTAVWKQ